MAFYQDLPPNAYKSESNGYTSWYQQCNCCPYGYHIDLDFVRYCESIGQQVERTGSFKRRRDRRRQRQSMEVLLGLEPPALFNLGQANAKAIEEEPSTVSPKLIGIRQSDVLQDGLEEAVFDFERTLQRSNKLSSNLPDVTAVNQSFRRVPSTSSMSSASGSSMTVLPSTTDCATRDCDVMSIESYGLSPFALHNIREQMALSLERTKELEEKVKLLPSLQAQVAALKEEKRQLILELKVVQGSEMNGNYISNHIRTSPYSHLRTNSLTHSASVESINRNGILPLVPRRDIGVTCSVLTRNVGVGQQHPHTKSVGTITLNGEICDGYADKWFNEKIRFLSGNNQLSQSYVREVKKPSTAIKETQTYGAREKKECSTQTLEIRMQDTRQHTFTQTLEIKKECCNIGILASPNILDSSSQTLIATSTIGTSDDTVDDTFCLKCNTEKHKLSDQISAISLASLTVPRSKSFNLGEDKLNLRNKTVACQYEPHNAHKACQHEIKSQSKGCQNDLKLSHKGVQHEILVLSKTVDTRDLDLGRKHVACNTKNTKIETTETACNTIHSVEKITSCIKCSKKDDTRKEDNNALPSKIPRPQIPTTPVENRKFKRQDTYTKIPSSANEASGLSGLDLSTKHDNKLPSPFEKIIQSYKLPDASSASQNGVPSSSQTYQESSLAIQEGNDTTETQRKKVKPSKEMQAAMKVLNDSLEKGQTKNLKNQLKNAISIIQDEWFKISCLITADPLDVEDYLDCFEDISFNLLRYIVNMVDDSGNTAMHYAVSHGNFDVVSILLDSKVCDINQPNKAGYTSVMLVSLADVCSPTHANVVRRLFQLADVNIRAKQHGQTALMLAVSHGRLDMVQMLLEAGADINIQDEDGSTALMCASEHGHVDIVKHFLSQPDCDSTITDVDGSTALKIAMEAGHRHIGVLLYAYKRNLHGGAHGSKIKKNKSSSVSPKTPSSPLPIRSSRRALTDSKVNK